jgi:fatty acid desaturase
MLTDEKKGLIRKKLKRGYPQGEIKEELRKEGYSEQEIEAAFNTLREHNSQSRGKFPISFVLGTGLVITGIAVLAIFPGASLGLFFLLGGAATFIVGFFLEKAKK